MEGEYPSWIFDRRAMPLQRQRLEVLEHSHLGCGAGGHPVRSPRRHGLAAASLSNHGLAGETPASPTGWKPVPRREAAKSKRGVRELPDAASIELLSIVCYSGGPPNLTVTSLEQF